ncbi:hypothetical protein AB8E30_06875 [Bacillus manliponensis]
MKKRLGLLLFVITVGYILYYDMRIGTLPMLSTYSNAKETVATVKKDVKETNKAYKSIEVKTGDTVLSITEEINKKKIPSIDQVIHDFKQLNNNTSPSSIQIGKSYKFPAYQ